MKYALLVVLLCSGLCAATAPGASSTAAADCASGWAVVDSPNAGTGHNELVAVAAVAPDDVWAAGFVTGTPSGSSNQMMLHFDGAAWTAATVPDNGGVPFGLAALDATSSDDVWAVGSGSSKAPTLHWDGAAWSFVDSPDQLNNPSLLGLDAVSPTDVWAVGYVLTGTPADPGLATLIEHWDGTAWTIVPSPSPGAQSSLSDVAAVSQNDVWAVGRSDGAVLIEHWDGTVWSVVPASSTGTQSGYLNAVAAISLDDVWAVGSYDANGAGALVEHWDGTSWTGLEQASLLGLNDVAAFSASDVWAVGTAVSHWDGATWAVIPGTAQNAGFSAVSIVPNGGSRDVWAVGLLTKGTGSIDTDTHTGRFCGPVVNDTSTATPVSTQALPGLPRTGGPPGSTDGIWLPLASGAILLLAGTFVTSVSRARTRSRADERPANG